MLEELAKVSDNIAIILGLIFTLCALLYGIVKYLIPLFRYWGEFFGGLTATQELLPQMMDKVDENAGKVSNLMDKVGTSELSLEGTTLGMSIDDHKHKVSRMEQALEHLMEQANMYAFAISMDGSLVYATRSLLYRMESSADSLYGFDWKSHIATEKMRNEVFDEVLSAVTEERTTVVRGVCIRLPDGTECDVEIHLNPLRTPEGVHIGHFGFVQSENPVLRRAERMYHSKHGGSDKG